MRVNLSVAIGLMLICTYGFGRTAANQGDIPAHPPLEQIVPDFAVEDGALIDGIAELSFIPNLELHIGFEEIIRERIMAPRDRSIRFSVHLLNKTVRQILDKLCQFDDRYTWSTDGLSVNVYPRASVNDSSYLLTLPLDRVVLKDTPDPDQAVSTLHWLLPGQQIGYMQMGGENEYKAPWTFTFEHLSVRQFVNRIAEHMGPHTSWVWQGGRNERMFTFLKGGFITRPRAPSIRDDG